MCSCLEIGDLLSLYTHGRIIVFSLLTNFILQKEPFITVHGMSYDIAKLVFMLTSDFMTF